MDDKDVRVGVIGAGDNLIRKILNSAQKVDGIRIMAIADIYEDIDGLLNALCERKNDDGTNMYGGKLKDNMDKLREMTRGGEIKYFSVNDGNFEDDFFEFVDGVHISTPNETHGHYAIMAAKHHRHILCEKPFVETHIDASATISKIKKAMKPKEIAMMSGTHYLRYGPSREFLSYAVELLDDTINNITAKFVEDKSYLNARTREQFSRRGAIHDMLVHYVALINRMRTKGGTGVNIVPEEGKTYRIRGYKNETAVVTKSDVFGVHFSPEAFLFMEAAKGAFENSKNITINFTNGRVIKLNYLEGQKGIFDSSGEKWWDQSRMNDDPYVEIYKEFRDEIRRLDGRYDTKSKLIHTLEDALLDLTVLDGIREISDEFPAKNYYGMQKFGMGEDDEIYRDFVEEREDNINDKERE